MATFQIKKALQTERATMAARVALATVYNNNNNHNSNEMSLKQRQQRQQQQQSHGALSQSSQNQNQSQSQRRRQRRRQQNGQQQQQQQQQTAATFDPPTAKHVNESHTSTFQSFNLPSSSSSSNSHTSHNNNNRNGNKNEQDVDTFNLLNNNRQHHRHRSSAATVSTSSSPSSSSLLLSLSSATNRLPDSTYADSSNSNSNTSCSNCCCGEMNTIKSNSSLSEKQTTNSNSTPLTTFCYGRIFRLDAAASMIMLTMLVVVALVISGNGVLASQRDVFKAKDNGNLNAIQNIGLLDSSSLAAVSGSSGFNINGNMPSNGISSNGNNKNVSIPAGQSATSTITSYTSTSMSTLKAPHSMTSDGNSPSTGNGNGNGTGTITTTATTTSTTSTSSTTSTAAAATTTTTSNGHNIASSSLHKVGSSSPSGISGINRNTIELVDDTRNGPYFDKAASKNVTALLGKTAYLNCRVKNLGNKTMLLQVSWVRHRDIHLLTVGRYTYTSDQRFRAIHQPQTEDWILQIKYPQHRDSGVYECQVSTTPHMSHYIHLNVVEPSTEIIGAPDLYIESGSTINLTCVILNSPEPPAYIFWNHNNAIINYDSPRGGVSVVTNKGETTTSFLLIKSARPSDSGLYQCNPSNAKPKSVTVHVLNGEFPAAMQHAAQAHQVMSPSRYLFVYLFVCFCSSVFVERSLRQPPLALRQHGAVPSTGGGMRAILADVNAY